MQSKKFNFEFGTQCTKGSVVRSVFISLVEREFQFVSIQDHSIQLDLDFNIYIWQQFLCWQHFHIFKISPGLILDLMRNCFHQKHYTGISFCFCFGFRNDQNSVDRLPNILLILLPLDFPLSCAKMNYTKAKIDCLMNARNIEPKSICTAVVRNKFRPVCFFKNCFIASFITWFLFPFNDYYPSTKSPF